MPMRTGISSLGRIFSRNRLSLPSIARLLAFGFATTLSFAPLAAEGQERPHPKQSASNPVASASDPHLWDKMAPFQNVYAQSSPNELSQFCCDTCFPLGACQDADCHNCVCHIR